jgi:hypothetical protein
MSIKLLTTINSGKYEYQGLSSDLVGGKPPVTLDANNGSTFYTVDTGASFIYHDGTWYNA